MRFVGERHGILTLHKMLDLVSGSRLVLITEWFVEVNFKPSAYPPENYICDEEDLVCMVYSLDRALAF